MDRVAVAEDVAPAIARLVQMPAYIGAVVAAWPRALARRAASGEFALVEHACHLRDLDREAFIVRARRMLAETLPTLEPFFGDVVAQERNYLAQDASRAANEFAAARAELTAFLTRLGADDLDREGLFAGERITVRRLVAMIEAHDAEHRAQIERLVEDLAAP